MTNLTWPIGPARCADENYVAEIIGLHEGYYVGVAWNALTETPAFPAMWRDDGKNANGHYAINLLPPKLTRDEVERLKEQTSNVSGNYLTLLAEPCIYCGQAEYEKKEAEARLRELREAVAMASHKIDTTSRFWSGQRWESNPMHPSYVTEVYDMLEAALAKSGES